MGEGRMQAPRAYADTAATELAKAETADTLTQRQFHQANAAVWSQLALAAAIDRQTPEPVEGVF